MLVEDDNNLREIYEARLLAEGYQIVSAHDGEEALALAVKEKPDLIIADVMMPKISGFDMLDILRSTPESKDTKVIMMTALSQAEDKARADKLGADRYLVKSQVTLEDVAKIAKEVLESAGAGPAAPSSAVPVADPTASVPSEPATDAPSPAPVSPDPVVTPVDTPAVAPVPAADATLASPDPAPAVDTASSGPTSITFDPGAVPGAPSDSSTPSATPDPVVIPSPDPASTQIPVVEAPVASPPESSTPSPTEGGEKIIQPLSAEPSASAALETPTAEPVVPAQPAPTVISPTQPASEDKTGPDPNLVAL